MKAVVMGVAIAVAGVAWDARAVARPCFELAAERFGVPAQLLRAIAEVESAGQPDAINRTHLAETGTYDIGLMQVNSGHLPALSRLGISEAHLKEPCTNLQVGAWILNQQISRHGPTWNAIGATVPGTWRTFSPCAGWICDICRSASRRWDSRRSAGRRPMCSTASSRFSPCWVR